MKMTAEQLRARRKRNQLQRDQIVNEQSALKRAAGLKYVASGRSVDEAARRLQAQIPEDTRDITARFCGDPLPGRSALDRR